MTKAGFLEAIQSRVARNAATASAVRGRGNAGTVAAARAHLRTIPLNRLRLGADACPGALDEATETLRTKLPPGAQHWGLARKVLNIFLRDCLYTTYLEKEFGLSAAEASLELPLDSITVTELKRRAGRGALPEWPGVRALKPALSSQYQAAAEAAATTEGIARVHLDALWWSVSRDADSAAVAGSK